MHVIHKFQLNSPLPYTKTKMTIDLPLGFKVLKVDSQNNVGTLWIQRTADLDAKRWPEEFLIIGTGSSHDLRNYEYIGTFFEKEFVWHVYRYLTSD